MISERNVKMFCCDDISNIENYDKAVADTTQVWDLHHRMETHRRNGTKRKFILSAKLLMEWGVYYNRPASELIFLTPSEHSALPKSEETRRKLSEAHKGNKGSKGMHWYTNGSISVQAKTCPEGFRPGRVYIKEQ